MRKTAFLLSFGLLFHFIGATQEVIIDFSKDYFRSNPFKSEFSNFLRHLINDPDIKDKVIKQRTDTSFFSFSGIYSSYNPFFFRPQRLEISLKETLYDYSDSLRGVDTIFLYQLVAYVPAEGRGPKDVKKEFDKIHRRYRAKFFGNNSREIKTGDVVTGGVHNYFVPFHGLSPLSLTWGRVGNEMVLNITLRLKSAWNLAALPAPLYGP